MPFFKSAKNRKFDYMPLYYDESKESMLDTGVRMDFRKGKLLNDEEARLGQMRHTKFSEKYRFSRKKRLKQMVLLLSMFGVVYGIYVYDINAIVSLLALLILLVVFIRENNKV